MQSSNSIVQGSDGFTLYSNYHPFSLSLRISSFASSTEEKRFINNCERLIRASVEYKQWREYLRDVLELNSCFLTHESSDECTVEIHHHIPSLFMIVKAVVYKFINEKREFSTFDICLEVMHIHFRNEIGYVCLVKTLHEKFHNGFLEIPIMLVQGNYQRFIDNYIQYLDPEDIDIIQSRLNVRNEGEKIHYIWSKNNYPNLTIEQE